MTKKRLIADGMFQSETVGALTYRQRWLWVGLISTADGQGRGRAVPAPLRGAIFAYDDISLAEVDADLRALDGLGMIQLYQAEGRALFQIVNWWTYQKPQWVGPSDYAPPDGWLDRLRKREKGGGIVTRNWPKETAATLRSMPYEDYLLTPHWKTTRAAALASDGYRCTACEATGHLQVHHLTYDHVGHELPEDLTVLCGACHTAVHGLTPQANEPGEVNCG